MPTLSPEQYASLKQNGLSDSEIKDIAEKKGYTIQQNGAVKDFSIGFAKGLVGDVARPTAQILQGLGQRVIAGVTPLSLDQVQKTTGFESLNDNSPTGQGVNDLIKTDNGTQTAGRVAANIASFFIPSSKGTQLAGRGLSAAGEKLGSAAIGLSSKEADLVQAYKAGNSVAERILAAIRGTAIEGRPILNSETALRNNLFGTESMIGVKARKAATNIWSKVIDPVLRNTSEVVDTQGFVNELRQEINTIPNATRRIELTKGLEALSEDFAGKQKINYQTLQRLKEGWAKFLPNKAFKGEEIAGTFKEVQNMASSLARSKIYNLFPDEVGKVAYLDYSNMKNLEELGQTAMTGQKLKGGAGSLISGLYQKAITPIASTGGLGLYKLGNGLEFVGAEGAKTLGQLFK